MKPVFPNEIILSDDTDVHKKNLRLFIMVLHSKSISLFLFHKAGRDAKREGTEDID